MADLVGALIGIVILAVGLSYVVIARSRPRQVGGHKHQWIVQGVQSFDSISANAVHGAGRQTRVLRSCAACEIPPEVTFLPGEWTLEQVQQSYRAGELFR